MKRHLIRFNDDELRYLTEYAISISKHAYVNGNLFRLWWEGIEKMPEKYPNIQSGRTPEAVSSKLRTIWYDVKSGKIPTGATEPPPSERRKRGKPYTTQEIELLSSYVRGLTTPKILRTPVGAFISEARITCPSLAERTTGAIITEMNLLRRQMEKESTDPAKSAPAAVKPSLVSHKDRAQNILDAIYDIGERFLKLSDSVEILVSEFRDNKALLVAMTPIREAVECYQSKMKPRIVEGRAE